jgi:hypothetical protein
MPYTPTFMDRFSDYARELGRVGSLSDWIAFTKRWFDSCQWPRKTPEQRSDESRNKRGPVELGGRTWSYTSWVFDLTPEARYEYFSALHLIGDPLKFPDQFTRPKRAADGWRQECPFCEISTDQLADDQCPKCGHPLLYVQYSE